MIIDSLKGGICWSQLTNYLKTPANKCTPEGLAETSNDTNDKNQIIKSPSFKRHSVTGEDLGGRFLKLLHASKISEQNNACLPVNRPHEVLAWDKLVKDSITSATNQINTPMNSVHLRRHQTFSTHHNRRLVKQITTEAELGSSTFVRSTNPSSRPFTMDPTSSSLYYAQNDSILDEVKKSTKGLSLSQKSLTFSNEVIFEEPEEVNHSNRRIVSTQSNPLSFN
ncbi:unnamed protein product, partial [Trichobilharzia regenti]